MSESKGGLKRTPLRDFHAAHGARLVDFAGWEMPVQYRSILEEHRAVRQAAGLFDVSHMGEFDVRGPQAGTFLSSLVTNDVAALFPGRILYTPMCHPDGGVVDDLLVYMRGPEDYLLCVNAGNIDGDLAWVRSHAERFEVDVEDRSEDYALLAVQGPRAAAIVQSLTGAKLGIVKTYHFAEGTVAGVQCLISRTGYTGEDGFELYHAPGDAPALAEAILEAGLPHGLQLCGLGSRDSLRLEAGYPLYGHELSREISPVAAGLGWTVKTERTGDFVGKAALSAEKKAGPEHRVVYFRTGDRRIVRAETPVVGPEGAAVGRVLSGTLSPILGESIGSALVPAAVAQAAAAAATATAAPGSGAPGSLRAEVRGAFLDLHLVKPPFVPLRKGA